MLYMSVYDSYVISVYYFIILVIINSKILNFIIVIQTICQSEIYMFVFHYSYKIVNSTVLYIRICIKLLLNNNL